MADRWIFGEYNDATRFQRKYRLEDDGVAGRAAAQGRRSAWN
jgi:hypothetical protein